MTPIRPEKPEDYEDAAEAVIVARDLRFSGLDRVLNDYIWPAINGNLADSRLRDMIFEKVFGHPRDGIKPDFWVWRRLSDVPRESDLCPFV